MPSIRFFSQIGPIMTSRRAALILVWGALVLVCAEVHAQVNTEKMRAFDVDGFRTTLDGDIVLESGNADLFEVGAGLRFDYRSGPHYAFSISRLRFGEEGGATFKDQSFAHLRYNYELQPWLVTEAFTQVQRDGFKLLRLRFLAGSGVRFQYVDTQTLKLFQGTTLMYEHENLDATEVTEHPVLASVGRWSNYVNVRLRVSENTSFINTVYVQPRLDAFADIRILDEAALAVAITEHLTLTTAFNLEYDSRPPDTVESLDIALRNGLTVTF